jgi:Bacterial protein of unknown function (DUF899)
MEIIMSDQWNDGGLHPPVVGRDAPALPAVVDRAGWQAEIDDLLVREKAHTREADAIAAARRRLPMVEVDPATPLIGERGPAPLIDVFEGRRQLVAYFFMWHEGKSAPDQCGGSLRPPRRHELTKGSQLSREDSAGTRSLSRPPSRRRSGGIRRCRGQGRAVRVLGVGPELLARAAPI